MWGAVSSNIPATNSFCVASRKGRNSFQLASGPALQRNLILPLNSSSRTPAGGR